MRARVLVLCVAVVAAGCSAASEPVSVAPRPTTSHTAEPASGIRVDLEESRLFATRRQLRLGMTNLRRAPVAVATIQLGTTLFEPVVPNRRDTILPPDRITGMPLDYGPARCETDGGDGAAAAVVVVDGRELRLPLDAPSSQTLAELHAEECREAEAAAAIEIRFADAWAPVGPGAVSGHLEVRQRARGVVAAVDDLRGTVIFTVDAATTEPLATVHDEGRAARLPVVVTASRCDAHALIESKRTFVFTAVVTIDGGDPVLLGVEPEGPGRQVLEDLLASCAP